MKIILSPAMNMERVEEENVCSQPIFQERGAYLADQLRLFDPWQLESQLGLNPQLALKAWQDYQMFGSGKGYPAFLAFRGMAYQNLQPQRFTAAEAAFAQEHLRILSAVYGVLRPYDGMHPYRLDFLCRFGKRGVDGKSLYRYWGADVHDWLFADTDLVVNLCSGEYTKLVCPYVKEGERLLACRFLVRKGDRLCCLATDSKMARGRMARFLLRRQAHDPLALQAFAWNDYRYMPQLWTEDEFVFVRDL